MGLWDAGFPGAQDPGRQASPRSGLAAGPSAALTGGGGTRDSGVGSPEASCHPRFLTLHHHIPPLSFPHFSSSSLYLPALIQRMIGAYVHHRRRPALTSPNLGISCSRTVVSCLVSQWTVSPLEGRDCFLSISNSSA